MVFKKKMSENGHSEGFKGIAAVKSVNRGVRKKGIKRKQLLTYRGASHSLVHRLFVVLHFPLVDGKSFQQHFVFFHDVERHDFGGEELLSVLPVWAHVAGTLDHLLLLVSPHFQKDLVLLHKQKPR